MQIDIPGGKIRYPHVPYTPDEIDEATKRWRESVRVEQARTFDEMSERHRQLVHFWRDNSALGDYRRSTYFHVKEAWGIHGSDVLEIMLYNGKAMLYNRK